jgi:hypothetical protein
MAKFNAGFENRTCILTSASDVSNITPKFNVNGKSFIICIDLMYRLLKPCYS